MPQPCAPAPPTAGRLLADTKDVDHWASPSRLLAAGERADEERDAALLRWEQIGLQRHGKPSRTPA